MNDSVVQPFLKRIDRPIVITFIIVFFLYNWKFFWLLFAPYSTGSDVSRIDLALGSLATSSYQVSLFPWTISFQKYLFTPIIYTVLSLFLIPVLDIIYHLFLGFIEETKILIDERIKIWSQDIQFNNKSETLRQVEKTKAVNSKIDALRGEIYRLGLKNTNSADTDKFYSSLKDKEKERFAKAIYALNEVVSIDRDFRHRSTGSVKLLNISNDSLILSEEAKSILEKFNTDNSSKLDP